MGAYWLHQFPEFVRQNYPQLGMKLQPGWELRSRSSGGFERIMGVCCHHDAGGASMSTQARANYSCSAQHAPIGNFILGVGGLRDIIMIAAGASNTQGRGGPYITSKGTVPLDDGNRRLIAIEAANTGTGSQDWNPAQQEAYLTLCAALCECYGLQPSDVMSHSDYTNPVNGGRTDVMRGSKRKIDPGGGRTPGRDWAEPNAVYRNMWRMDNFERDLRAMMNGNPNPGDDDMPKTATPTRVDSRSSAYQSKLKAGENREVWLTCPPDTKFAVLNVVMLPTDVAVRGWCSVSGKPYSSGEVGTTVNWSIGSDVAQAQVTIPVKDGKKIYLHANRDANFVIDFTGTYFS